MNIQGCIFDLDGVIVDTAKYHYLAWNHIAKELGFEFTEQDNERLKGVSRMQSLEILLSIGKISANSTIKEQLAGKKNTIYLTYIDQLTPKDILPGTTEFLKELRENGIRTALGSASKNAMSILDRLSITTLFDAIIDGNKVEKAKPNPEIFLKGAEALDLTPSHCVVFEDAEAGIEAALAAGMKCIGIGNQKTLRKAHSVVSGLNALSYDKLNNLLASYESQKQPD